MARMGPLLRQMLSHLESAGPDLAARERLVAAAHVGAAAEEDRLPLVLQTQPRKPRRGETWPEYKERIARDLEPLGAALAGEGKARPLYLANAIAASLPTAQAAALGDNDAIALVELDPIVNPTVMDDAILDVGIGAFRNRHGSLTGTGVRVAILDSGIDGRHPHLVVADAVSTCGEDVAIPGRHGTHCAGSLASRDPVFPGVAPDVTLLNVKVLRANGTGTNSDITKGIDEALDREADVLSMSVGFNHLPSWSDGGHGWSCPDGRCPLCTAVDHAVAFGAVAVVAAGNEHQRADALRRFGFGNAFDTEYGCPGQARGAITVGALTKRTFLPAEFSSRGATSYSGGSKPDIAGPGVNVMSTVPAPRRPNGTVEPSPARADLFGRDSGTSMATPMVAGAVALLIQHRRAQGLPVNSGAIRGALLAEAAAPMTLPANLVGAGRVDLSRFGAIIPTT